GDGAPAREGGGALMDGVRAVAAPTRRDRSEAALVQRAVDIALFVARRDSLGVGRNPHLDEVHLFGRRRVYLRVLDAGSRAHPLREAGIELTVVAFGVAMLQAAGQDPGHDLHVAVEVRREPGRRRNAIVVVHEQQTMMRVRGVVVATEAEAVPAVEPADLRVRTGSGAADVDRAHVSYLS